MGFAHYTLSGSSHRHTDHPNDKYQHSHHLQTGYTENDFSHTVQSKVCGRRPPVNQCLYFLGYDLSGFSVLSHPGTEHLP